MVRELCDGGACSPTIVSSTLRDALMQTLTAGRARVLVERVLNQRVLEPEAPRQLADLGDERGRDCLFQYVEHLVFGLPAIVLSTSRSKIRPITAAIESRTPHVVAETVDRVA